MIIGKIERNTLIATGLAAVGLSFYLILKLVACLDMPEYVANRVGTRNSLAIFKSDLDYLVRGRAPADLVSSVDLTRVRGACSDALARFKKYQSHSTEHHAAAVSVNQACRYVDDHYKLGMMRYSVLLKAAGDFHAAYRRVEAYDRSITLVEKM